jgi:hypothetical protein
MFYFKGSILKIFFSAGRASPTAKIQKKRRHPRFGWCGLFIVRIFAPQ